MLKPNLDFASFSLLQFTLQGSISQPHREEDYHHTPASISDPCIDKIKLTRTQNRLASCSNQIKKGSFPLQPSRAMATSSSSSSSYLLFLFVYVVLPTATSLSFSFPSFNSSTDQFIAFQNDTFLNGGISLANNDQDSNITYRVGRAYYKEPIPLYNAATGKLADFTTRFSFIINNISGYYPGDGMAFFLSPFPSVVPPNSSGGSLGLVDSQNNLDESANQIVAVEFDTFKNYFDPNDNHVGINVNSMKSAATVMWNSSIKDGRKANAWISYNATTKNLSVFLTYEDNPIFAGNSSLYHIVDLSKILPEGIAVGFSAATGLYAETHSVLSWEFNSTPLHLGKRNRVGLIVGITVSTFLLLVAASFLWFFLRRKKNVGGLKGEEDDSEDIDDGEFEKGRGPKKFPFGELAAATRNFADELKLGQGGFGGVYRGFLAESNLDVAIKRVSKGSQQGKKEYISEVKIISRLRHRNLVQLVGWCHERKELLLVYEFMPNGSLDSYLYNRDSKKYLSWPLRYLHEEWEECVVHRDVKPSNVMLDGGFNAKLGDFGLARLVDHERGSQTTMLAGTMGYLAPEIVTTSKANRETDVYSFGVVALELACGRRPVEPKRTEESVVLVSWVWELYGRGALLEAADERLNSEFDEGEMARLMIVGLWCSHPDSALRPSIRQAVAALKLEAPLPELPSKMPVPTYYAPSLEMRRFTYSSSSAGASMVVMSMSSDYITNGSGAASSAATNSSGLLKSEKIDL